jgi:hypothetical protein
MDATLELVAGGHRLGAALFGLPFGKLDAGAPADLVVLDYRPPTPLTTANVGGHLLFGIDRSPRAVGDGGGALGRPRPRSRPGRWPGPWPRRRARRRPRCGPA